MAGRIKAARTKVMQSVHNAACLVLSANISVLVATNELKAAIDLHNDQHKEDLSFRQLMDMATTPTVKKNPYWMVSTTFLRIIL